MSTDHSLPSSIINGGVYTYLQVRVHDDNYSAADFDWCLPRCILHVLQVIDGVNGGLSCWIQCIQYETHLSTSILYEIQEWIAKEYFSSLFTL